MRVDVDPAGHDVLAGCVDHPLGSGRKVNAAECRPGLQHADDDLAVDEHVGRSRARWTHDGPVLDEQCHSCVSGP